jgi:hypothetical protein
MLKVAQGGVVANIEPQEAVTFLDKGQPVGDGTVRSGLLALVPAASGGYSAGSNMLLLTFVV